jgi:hypothetical protein
MWPGALDYRQNKHAHHDHTDEQHGSDRGRSWNRTRANVRACESAPIRPTERAS